MCLKLSKFLSVNILLVLSKKDIEFIENEILDEFKPGANILIDGVSFKEDTSDTRETPSINIANNLKKKGYKVYLCDENITSIIDSDGSKWEVHDYDEVERIIDNVDIILKFSNKKDWKDKKIFDLNNFLQIK